MSRVALPYNLQEGTVAYAMKVMANFRALLGIYNNVSIPGLGEGDVDTMLKLLAEAMVKAGEAGNTADIVFPDGETIEEKFNAGTLNASLLNSDGLFYLTVGSDGHLYVTASDSVNAEQFSIDRQPSSETYGHLLYTLTDPEPGGAVHTYDLGSVIGPAGPSGTGDMAASVYDPNGQHKDVNMYVGYFNCPAAGWGSYFLTFDATAQAGKTYYTYNSQTQTYAAATVAEGATLPANTYYEKLPENECLITDEQRVGGATLTGLITATLGHAIIEPSYDATDGDKTAWNEGMVTGVAQGNGWLRLRTLGTTIETDVPLAIAMWQ